MSDQNPSGKAPAVSWDESGTGTVPIAPHRRYRCAKGHVSFGAHFCVSATEAVPFCPYCFADFLKDRCGPLEEVP